MRDRGSGSKHFESRDNIGQVQRAGQQPTAAHWRSEADEFDSYHTDFDLQVSIELDESQGLYDDQAHYRLPTANHTTYSHAQYAPRPVPQPAYNYQTHGMYTQPAQRLSPRTAAYAPQAQAAPARAHSQAPRAAVAPRGVSAQLPRTAAGAVLRGTTGAAVRGAASAMQRTAANSMQRTAANSMQRAAAGAALRSVPSRVVDAVTTLPAARSARSGIRPATSARVASAPAQYARYNQGSTLSQPTAAQPALQLSTRRPSKPVRRFVDDEPLQYPGARKRGWFGKVVIVLLLAGVAVATRSYLEMHAAPKAVALPVAPPPAAVIQDAPGPAAAPEPAAAAEEAPAPPPAPALPLTPQERRAAARAARAALYAERKREREEAREARLEARRARAAEADAPAPSKHVRVESDEVSTSKSWRTESDVDSTTETQQPAHANSDAELLAPEPARESDVVEPAQPKRAAMADNGTLRINSRPWSVVFVDGHSVGNTPQMNLMLPAGEHEITLVNDEMQLRKSLTVQIAPGAIVTRTLNLGE